MSFSLPRIVRSFTDRRVASTREGDLVVVETASGIRYAVFFTLRRAGQRRVDLFAISAYPLAAEKTLAMTGKMRFAILLQKLLDGERLRFPPR